MKYLILGLTFGISISVVSWMIGIIFNGIFMKTEFYKKFSNLNFIESKLLNKTIGLGYFKWIVQNSFFKYFNQQIKLENNKVDLNHLRYQMTLAENSHLVGFIFVIFFAIFYCFKISIIYGLAIMIPNIFLNFYPSLLQQENKRRID
ncbi:MAG: hypothetical protein WCP74_04615 [Sphingobacteriia bacterium]|jgi:hypothetical protein